MILVQMMLDPSWHELTIELYSTGSLIVPKLTCFAVIIYSKTTTLQTASFKLVVSPSSYCLGWSYY